ncbi:MAG: cysteine--1-D-myo-inosityl 2-amino-2-deoxy-alpha-D-glucopyranoside ligase, partial [Hamadaea sp.]|nr:cysteine--1-D-myo-inosityl 2-amino-2-deoxy-alpha-D-glucopyranoside ligase [Hamadaea sp.]
LLAGVRTALTDDLDTPKALALVDEWVDGALSGEGDDADAPDLMSSTVDALLGVYL